jgi:hypothetical protein
MLRIARNTEHRNRIQKFCGGVPRAYTCTHLFALQFSLATLAKQSRQKTKKKAEKLQKSASFDPIRVTGNYGLGKVSS